MKKDARIDVLGASGLVGGAIINKLLEKGYTNVIGVYRSRKPNFPDIKLIQLDLTRQADTEAFFEREKPEYVFLASAKVGGILANSTYKADFIYENLAIAVNVISSAYKYGVKKLLNLGSSCIYPKYSPQPMKEEYLLSGSLEPTNEPYAISKISAIKLCRYFNEQYGTNFFSVMPTNLYGPGDNFNLETSHALPALIRKFHLAKLLEMGDVEGIKKDLKRYPIGFGLDNNVDFSDNISILKTITLLGIKPSHFSLLTFHVSRLTSHFSRCIVVLWGSGEVYREFLYVDDLADACVYLMEKVDAEDMRKISSDYFVNVGTGDDIKIKDLAKLIADIVGFKGNIEHDLSKPDGTPRKLLDVSKMRELGWMPNIPLKKGLKRTYNWYIQNLLI